MPRRDPVSIFFGPHRAFEDLAQWPPTIIAAVQLFGLELGSLGDPSIPAELTTRQILTPSATPGLWQRRLRRFTYNLIHTTTTRTFDVFQTPSNAPVFALTVPFAINRWAYNAITEPAGVFAFGGSATLSWKEP